MAKFTEDQLAGWTNPPSDTEEGKLQNAEKMVRDAIREYEVLKPKSIEVFGQGSYANNTNVKLNSDIDINVHYTGGFYFKLPEGKQRTDFNLNSPSEYSLEDFKNDVEMALRAKFGDDVKRKNKCITVEGNTNRVEIDVVPTWKYHRYRNDGTFVVGAKLKPDIGAYIVNYPKQHIANGKKKNEDSQRVFKRLTRIIKKVRYHMIDNGEIVSANITSFLLECLIWNVPNNILTENDTWNAKLKASIVYIYEQTKSDDTCGEWGEVSELLYLFIARKWSREDVNNFMIQMWNYLEYNND